MRKIILAIVMVFILAAPVIADAPVIVRVNDNVLTARGVIISGRTYVPLRAIGESLGAQVDWNGQTKWATIVTEKRPTITGDSNSVAVINQALDLLKYKDAADYEMVCRYTEKITISDTKVDSPNGEAYAIVQGKGYVLSPVLFQRELTYIASTLVHESSHLCDRDNAINILKRETENVAYLHQITALRILDASQKDIDETERTRLQVIK